MSYVMYRRVSTVEQGSSGLGLAAQLNAIDNYIASVDGDLIGAYQDIQSGAKDNRDGLQKALRACRVNKATLVVSKLCRLSRSFAYSAKILDSEIPIVVTENTNASTLELRLKAIINSEERERISIRTIEALQVKKLKGEELGNSDVWKYAKNQDTTIANRVRAAKSLEYKQYMADLIKAHYGDELPSLGTIADWLNAEGYKTPRGSLFTRVAVKRILDA